MYQNNRIASFGLSRPVLSLVLLAAAMVPGCSGALTGDERDVSGNDTNLRHGRHDRYERHDHRHGTAGGPSAECIDCRETAESGSWDPCPWGYVKILGTEGDDVLIGTSHRDCILGFGGNDVIYGLGRDDYLVGGSGDDLIQGGSGDDRIYGGDGNDEIAGGDGDDKIEGGGGNDRIEGGSGRDYVQGGMCHDTIKGNKGKDTLRGNAGSDRIKDDHDSNVNGGDGIDACKGYSCEVSLHAEPCTKDADCRTGKQCVVATGVCVPAGSVPMTDETCDGLDEDCDGRVDEEFVGDEVTCGIGACARTGSATCEDGEIVVDSCTPGTPAADDASCNNSDDDCDGQVDEDFVSQTTTCGTGACAATGSTSCVGGMVVDSCTPGAGAADDATCDGIDDDCSGQADEDYVSHMTTCGTGSCAGMGATSCVGGVELDSCMPGGGSPSDFTCDGVDDDCNGQFDEDYVPQPTTCGVGACSASGATSCVGGAEQDSCTPGTPAADDATCDGVDDDCDGQSDEDFAPSCSGTVRQTCVGGQLQTFECNDADACNGLESCDAGACVPGTPVDIDDGDPCTTDACDPSDGSVTHTPVPVGTSCSDGLVCNGEELCLGGDVAGCQPLPSGAVAWWRGENNADDSAGSHDGTLVNGAFTPGQVSQAFSFSGDDAVNLNAHAAALNLSTGQATLEFWLRSTSDSCATLFSLREDDGDEQQLQLGNGCHPTLINELLTWRYTNGTSTSTVGFVTPTRSVLLNGAWHHVALTFDGTTTGIYIDGVARTVTVLPGTDHGNWGGFPAPTRATIGARDNGTGALVSFVVADLDEVTLYDRPLAPAEIAAIHSAGSAGKCGGGGAITCTDGPDAPAGTSCEDGGVCDGAGSCQ